MIFGLFFLADIVNCQAQEPRADSSTSCTRLANQEIPSTSSDNDISMMSFLKENIITSGIVIGLIGLFSYIYYRHINQYTKGQVVTPIHNAPPEVTSVPVATATTEGSLTSVTSNSLETSFSSHQTSLPLLEISSSEAQIAQADLRSFGSQPNLSILTHDTPPSNRVPVRKLSSTPPTYAQPIAVRTTDLSSPTSGAQFTQSWRAILARLDTDNMKRH